MSRVYLNANDTVAPGQQKTFTWTVVAPSTAGTYNFQWRMVREGVTWFGATTTNVAVAIAATANAAQIAQTVPSTMTAGQSHDVSVTMQNTGSSTWTAAGAYRLGSVNPSNNLTWGMSRVYLSGNDGIAPGQQKTFTWTITAPTTPGTYNFQWRMVQEGVAWFGAATENMVVEVVP
jgi:uncharacterized membrane protein